MTESTPLEALVAEMLGDIGKLHDLIKALPEAIKEAIAPSLGALVITSKEAQASIQQLGAAERVDFSNFTAADKNALRSSIVASLNEGANTALAAAAKELKDAAKIHNDAAKGETARRWQWIAITFVVGVFAGAIGFYGSHLLYGKQQAEQAAFGRAVGTVWDGLEARTKERIQAARNNQ